MLRVNDVAKPHSIAPHTSGSWRAAGWNGAPCCSSAVGIVLDLTAGCRYVEELGAVVSREGEMGSGETEKYEERKMRGEHDLKDLDRDRL